MEKQLSLREKILKGLIEERKRLKRKLIEPINEYNQVERTLDEIKYQEIGKKIQEFRFS